MSNSPYYYEEIMRHRSAELKRNELLAQHAALVRAEQPRKSRFANSRTLIARVPRLRSRSIRRAYV
jgi:hypothetical protein